MRSRGVYVIVALAVACGFVGCDWVLGLHAFGPGAGVDSGCSIPTTASFGLVQQVTAGSAAATTLDGNLGCPPAQGDVLVLVGATVNRDLDPPTGGGVTTWIPVARSNQQTNIELWIGKVDAPASAVTINCSRCTASEQIWMSITEWSGLTTDNLVDGRQNASGSGGGANTATTPVVSTLHAPDLLIFGVSATKNMGTDIQGWTPLMVIKEDIITQGVWYQVTSATGSFSASVPVTGIWDAVLGAIRAN